MMLPPDRFSAAERIVAHDGPHAFEAVVPPIVQTSLFTFATVSDMVETYAGRRSRDVYSRTTNPTVSLFEAKMAALEGAEEAIGFPSGMAAISGSVLAFVAPGDRILCVRHVYPDAYRLFETLMRRFGVSVDYVDGGDLAAVAAALPGAKLLYLESPTSWTMEAHDVGALAALARQHGAMSLIDNSWATPVFQQPLSLGVDLVLHSASKYIGGHSDVVAGVVAGRSELVVPHPPHDLPLHRGQARPARSLAAAAGPADAAGTAAPARGRGPHAGAAPRRDARRRGRVPPGPGGSAASRAPRHQRALLVRRRRGVDIPAFCDALALFKLGVSWGGHESLVVPALVTRVQAAGPNSAVDFGVPERMVRLHVGLEGPEALWADLAQALKAATDP